MKSVSVLGSTGSVGVSTLDVVKRSPDSFRIVALTAHRNVERLVAQCLEFQPEFAAVADPDLGHALESGLQGSGIRCGAGPDAVAHAAALDSADAVMAAIVGGAGLAPTLAAANAGKQVLLANKEAIVMSGALFIRACQQSGAVLLPIDSEHNAIFQCLPEGSTIGKRPDGIAKIILTASGGPFLTASEDTINTATPDQACAHPQWEMGRKISVDSATLMNKGLEIIEAHWLFGLPLQDIDVVVHPQSVIHSLVHYKDGSMLAQLGRPDMRVPIAHALGWPERVVSGVDGADLPDIGQLNFQKPDSQKFPALAVARAAAEAGSATTIALNAANEVAVRRFLEYGIQFPDIMKLVSYVVDQTEVMPIDSLEEIFECDQAARAAAEAWVGATS